MTDDLDHTPTARHLPIKSGDHHVGLDCFHNSHLVAHRGSVGANQTQQPSKKETTRYLRIYAKGQERAMKENMTCKLAGKSPLTRLDRWYI